MNKRSAGEKPPQGQNELTWPSVPRAPMLHDDTGQAWHVAINEHSTAEGKAGKPWPSWMYQAKNAAQEVPRLALILGMEREGKLPKAFRQCSHSEEREVIDNHLTCCLGVECRKCPHLLALDKATVSPEKRDWLKAWTCAGHILTSGGDKAGEGYLLTTEDRMYWDSVYSSLAGADHYCDGSEES